MATATRTQRRYDHRLRTLVRTTRDIRCALQRGVPRSTARGWLTDSDVPVVSVEALNLDATQLQREVLRLHRRIQKLTALLRVLLAVFKISGYSLNRSRLPDGGGKRSLLRAIEQSRSALPLRCVLRVVRLSPHAKCGHHGDDPLPLYVVYVREEEPPKGEKRLEWMLLTNEPVLTYDDAWRVVQWYERRWVVEEYHKALKTGCQIEDLQFNYVDRLQPAIALLSALALTLLNLRDVSRSKELQARPATDPFAREYVQVLSLRRYRERRDDLTVQDFFLALARLGGHQNRKRDKRPGWLILWRGWTKLQLMLDGYELAKEKCGHT
jgi:hypothetical protein